MKRDPPPDFVGFAISPPNGLPPGTFDFFYDSLSLSAVTFYASKLVFGPFGLADPGLPFPVADPPS